MPSVLLCSCGVINPLLTLDGQRDGVPAAQAERKQRIDDTDRKSTRLNSSHTVISYAVFCLKKKKKKIYKHNLHEHRLQPVNRDRPLKQILRTRLLYQQQASTPERLQSNAAAQQEHVGGLQV